MHDASIKRRDRGQTYALRSEAESLVVFGVVELLMVVSVVRAVHT